MYTVLDFTFILPLCLSDDDIDEHSVAKKRKGTAHIVA